MYSDGNWQISNAALRRKPGLQWHTSASGSKNAPEGHGSGWHALECGLHHWPSSHGAELAVGIVIAPIGINAIAGVGARRRTHFFMCQPPFQDTSGRPKNGAVDRVDGSKRGDWLAVKSAWSPHRISQRAHRGPGPPGR